MQVYQFFSFLETTAKKSLTKFIFFDRVEKRWGRSEAGLSRWPVKPEIAGSSPVAPVYARLLDGLFFTRAVAQLVARLVRDQEVAGSNPACPIVMDWFFGDVCRSNKKQQGN